MADITAARINNLQSSIALVLGSGSGQNGYGQVVSSSPVTNTGDVVNAEDMNFIGKFENFSEDLPKLENLTSIEFLKKNFSNKHQIYIVIYTF